LTREDGRKQHQTPCHPTRNGCSWYRTGRTAVERDDRGLLHFRGGPAIDPTQLKIVSGLTPALNPGRKKIEMPYSTSPQLFPLACWPRASLSPMRPGAKPSGSCRLRFIFRRRGCATPPQPYASRSAQSLPSYNGSGSMVRRNLTRGRVNAKRPRIRTTGAGQVRKAIWSMKRSAALM